MGVFMQRNKKMTDQENKMIEMFKKGKTLKEIGKVIGYSTTTISTRLAELGYHKHYYAPATMKLENKPLEDWQLDLLNEMKVNNYPEERMAYMLGMNLDYLKKKGYL